jgi:hypothetical protein
MSGNGMWPAWDNELGYPHLAEDLVIVLESEEDLAAAEQLAHDAHNLAIAPVWEEDTINELLAVGW